VLWSMSSADSDKFQKISASLAQAFSLNMFQGGAEAMPSGKDGAFDSKTSAFTLIRAQVGSIAEPSTIGRDLDIRLDREGVVVSLAGNFLFETGRAELRPEALPVLDGFVNAVRHLPNEIRVGGHTDDVPIQSPLYGSNWELSSARALAVVKYLSAAGIAATRLSGVGHGEYRPVVPNDSRANRAKNRRADLLVVFPDGPAPGSPFGSSTVPGAARATPALPARAPATAQESHP
jgi:chemotaxis protein MotB